MTSAVVDWEWVWRRALLDHVPRRDHTACDDIELILRLAGTVDYLVEAVIAMIDRPHRIPEDVEVHATALVANLSPEVLARLYAAGAHPDVLVLVVRRNAEVDALSEEFFRRLRRRTLGTALFGAGLPSAGASDAERLRHALATRRFGRQRPERDPDLHHEDVTKALECVSERQHDLGETFAATTTRVILPPLLDFPPLDRSRWDRVQTRQDRLIEAVVELLPLLNGDAEAIPERVRLAKREIFRKRKAAKRASVEVPFDDDEHGRAAARNDTEEAVAARAAVEQARAVLRPHAARGEAFFEARVGGATIEEAAAKAGVSRETGKQYIRKLRKSLADRDP